MLTKFNRFDVLFIKSLKYRFVSRILYPSWLGRSIEKYIDIRFKHIKKPYKLKIHYYKDVYQRNKISLIKPIILDYQKHITSSKKKNMYLFNPSYIKTPIRLILKGGYINLISDYSEYFIIRKGFQEKFFEHILLKNGIVHIHGAATSDGNRAYIIAGSSGSGKTFLSLSFLEDGFKMLSDNFSLINGRKSISYIEPIRIKKGDIPFFKKNGLLTKLTKTPFVTFKKINYTLNEEYIEYKGKNTKKIFLIKKGKTTKIKKIERDTFIESQMISLDNIYIKLSKYDRKYARKKLKHITRKIDIYEISYTNINNCKKLILDLI